MWEQIPLPEIKSTIRACSVPENGDSLAVWTDEGVFRVRLHPSPSLFRMYAAKDAEKKFDAVNGQFSSHGNMYPMHGDCGKHGLRTVANLLTEHPHGFTVEVDERKQCLRMLDATGNVQLTVAGVDANDRWRIAHFSRNFSNRTQSPYFVACDSKSLRVFVYQPSTEGVPSKWSVNSSKETRESLWNAIIENPDDDTPRLIYADWLEENGDRERAEFIRLQCRIAERESQGFISPEDPDLVLNRQMEEQYGSRWISEQSEIKGIRFQPSFWRGFPKCSVISTSLATRSKPEQHVLSTNPMESIHLSLFRVMDVDRLEKWNLLSRWRTITIHSAMAEIIPHYARLFLSPRLTGLRNVTFGGWLGQQLCQALASGGPFPELHTVVYDMFLQDLNAFDFSILCGARGLPHLKTVIFYIHSESRRLQDRDDIRKLAAKVENVVQVLHVMGKPSTVTRLYG